MLQFFFCLFSLDLLGGEERGPLLSAKLHQHLRMADSHMMMPQRAQCREECSKVYFSGLDSSKTSSALLLLDWEKISKVYFFSESTLVPSQTQEHAIKLDRELSNMFCLPSFDESLHITCWPRWIGCHVPGYTSVHCKGSATEKAWLWYMHSKIGPHMLWFSLWLDLNVSV